MTDERDRRRHRTPPLGVRAQTAPPLEDAQSWDGDVTPLPDDPRLAIARIDRRVKVTGQAQLDRVDLVRTAIATTGQAQLDRVELLRNQIAADVRDVNSRMDQLADRLAEISAGTAKLGGQLDLLMGDRAIDRQASSTVLVETARASIEVRKTTALADVSELAARAAHRRRVVMRVLQGVGAVWGAVSALLLARGCP